MYHNGEWGTVCDDIFGNTDAGVSCNPLQFFAVYIKLAEKTLLYSKYLTAAKKLPPVGLNIVQKFIAGLEVKCLITAI